MRKRAISNLPPYLPRYMFIGEAISRTYLLKWEKSHKSKGNNHSRCPGSSHQTDNQVAQPWQYHQVCSQAVTFLKKGHIIYSKTVVKTGPKVNTHFKYCGKKNAWLCCSKKEMLCSVPSTCWTAGGAQKFSLRLRVHFTLPIWGLNRSETLWSSIAPGEGSLMRVNQLMGDLISIFMFCDDFRLHSVVMVCLHLSVSGGCSQGCSAQCPSAVTCSCV